MHRHFQSLHRTVDYPSSTLLSGYCVKYLQLKNSTRMLSLLCSDQRSETYYFPIIYTNYYLCIFVLVKIHIILPCDNIYMFFIICLQALKLVTYCEICIERPQSVVLLFYSRFINSNEILISVTDIYAIQWKCAL